MISTEGPVGLLLRVSLLSVKCSVLLRGYVIISCVDLYCNNTFLDLRINSCDDGVMQ